MREGGSLISGIKQNDSDEDIAEYLFGNPEFYTPEYGKKVKKLMEYKQFLEWWGHSKIKCIFDYEQADTLGDTEYGYEYDSDEDEVIGCDYVVSLHKCNNCHFQSFKDLVDCPQCGKERSMYLYTNTYKDLFKDYPHLKNQQFKYYRGCVYQKIEGEAAAAAAADY